MRFTASALLGLALLLLGNVARAQGSPPLQGSSVPNESEEDSAWAWSYFMFEEVLLRSCDDPTLKTALALPQPKLILETTDVGDTRVKAHAGFEIKNQVLLNLEVEGPRKPSEDTTTLASLEGLSNGSTAELKFSWVGWKPEKTHQEFLSMIQAGKAKAAREAKRIPTEAKETLTEASPKDMTMEDLVASETGTKWLMEDYLDPTLSRPSAIAMLGPERYQKATRLYTEWMRKEKGYWWIPVVNVNVSAEQKDFQFFREVTGPPAGRKKTSESHTNHALTASGGFYMGGRVYAAFNYSREKMFVDGRTEEFCSASGPANVLNCTPLVTAPPKEKKPETLEFEIRSLFGSFGAAAHLKRDLQANVTTVDVPIYFLQKMGSTSMELNGGVAVGWRSDTKDYSLSVFVGPALSTVLRMLGAKKSSAPSLPPTQTSAPRGSSRADPR